MKLLKTVKEEAVSEKNWLLKLSSKKKILIIAILLIGGFLLFRNLSSGQQKPQYQTAQVTKGSIITTVSESGNVASGSQAAVGSPTTGIIQEIYVKDGDTVIAGQNLFKVKSTATAQEIASAWASYQMAVSSANSANQTRSVNQTTLEKDRAAIITAASAVSIMQSNGGLSGVNSATNKNYTQNDIDIINSGYTSAQEQFSADQIKYNQGSQAIASANSSVNSALLSYQATQDSVVTAPLGGIVANITVQVGDQITASGGNLSSNISTTSNSSSATNAVLSVGNFSNPYMKVQASEVDVPTIKAGQKATITLDAFPDKTFVGTVNQVDTVGTISSGVVNYNVFITFVSPPDTIRPGMSGTVIIQTARKDDVLTIPSAALQTTNGQSTVRVLQNGAITNVSVVTGLSSDTDVEITSGLAVGDTVVTGVVTTSQSSSSSGASPFSGVLRTGGFGGGGGGGARTTGGAPRGG